MIAFPEMPKIARLSREMIVTEKLDGTNASVYVPGIEGGELLFGSRTRWITPGKHTDNYGFAAWGTEHEAELRMLGPGHHFGEWWGKGIQRNYGLTERRFSLFNVTRWTAEGVVLPPCVSLVPRLSHPGAIFEVLAVDDMLDRLRIDGSTAAPGFMLPEGVVVFHVASGQLFKKTIGNDGNKGAKTP